MWGPHRNTGWVPERQSASFRYRKLQKNVFLEASNSRSEQKKVSYPINPATVTTARENGQIKAAVVTHARLRCRPNAMQSPVNATRFEKILSRCEISYFNKEVDEKTS